VALHGEEEESKEEVIRFVTGLHALEAHLIGYGGEQYGKISIDGYG